MSHADVAELLSQTLGEEKAADAKLTELAEGGINAEAAGDQSDMGGRRRLGRTGSREAEGGRAMAKPAAQKPGAAQPALAKTSRR
jgi:hypothetical protein